MSTQLEDAHTKTMSTFASTGLLAVGHSRQKAYAPMLFLGGFEKSLNRRAEIFPSLPSLAAHDQSLGLMMVSICADKMASAPWRLRNRGPYELLAELFKG